MHQVSYPVKMNPNCSIVHKTLIAMVKHFQVSSLTILYKICIDILCVLFSYILHMMFFIIVGKINHVVTLSR
jgi:hypothetical protein